MDKTRTTLESPQHKKKPLRDQLGLCEKLIADISIQKTKITLSVEKLQVSHIRIFLKHFCAKNQSPGSICNLANPTNTLLNTQKVHFRSGIGGDSKITETAYAILHDLDELNQLVKSKNANLEQALSQLEDYQQQMQNLRQKIIHEEQQLRLVLAPTYLPHDRDKAITEQQVRMVFHLFQFNLTPSTSILHYFLKQTTNNLLWHRIFFFWNNFW